MLIFRPTAFLLAAFAAPQDPAPAGSTPADWLPSETLAAFEVPDLAGTVRTFFASEPWKRFDHGALGQQLRSKGEFVAMQFGLNALAKGAGAEPDELLEAIAGNGGVAGIVVADGYPQFVMVLNAFDPELAQDGINSLLNLMTQGSVQVGGDAWRQPIEDLFIERRGPMFLLASAAEALDKLDPSAGERLDDLAGYQAARAAAAPADVQVWLSPQAIAEGTRDIEDGKLAEAGASLFFGKVAAIAEHAEWMQFGLDIEHNRIDITAVAPADFEQLEQSHAPFFPKPVAVEQPTVDDQIGSFVFSFDLGPWWTSRADFITNRAMADTLKSDQTLTTIFQRDFGVDVLHRLEPAAQLVVARVPFSDGAPSLEFPAAAIGLRAKPDQIEDLSSSFYGAFTSVLTFTNFDSSAMGDETLRVREPKLLSDGSRLYGTYYKQLAEGRALPPRFNLSPALMLQPDGEIWLSTSTALLQRIAEAPRETVLSDGDRLDLEVAPGRRILAADRPTLIAQQTMAHGGDSDAAAREFDKYTAALALFDRAYISAKRTGAHYTVSFGVASDIAEVSSEN